MVFVNFEGQTFRINLRGSVKIAHVHKNLLTVDVYQTCASLEIQRIMDECWSRIFLRKTISKPVWG